MLTLAVVALAAIAFTLAFMVWEYSRQNTVLHDYIERLEQSREDMRLKIAAAERVQENIETDKPKPAQKPQRITKQTVLGRQKGRKVRPTKHPRAFISSNVKEWVETVPYQALERAVERYNQGTAQYICSHGASNYFSFEMSYKSREYTSEPFYTRTQAEHFRNAVFTEHTRRKLANVKA